MFYYEIHVTGKNGFSTCVISDFEMDDDDIILLAYENDILHDDDCHYIDYINELTFEEWDTHFNFNKKDYMCVNCGGGFEEIFTDEERDADFCKDCYERNNE
jgi:hypothetical protein